MASSQFGCSIRQGFNFERDAQVLVGHLVSITIGGTALTADITLTLPTDLTNATAVVGVISDISWQGGYADPIDINFNVSTENQKVISILKHSTLSDTTVVYQFNIYKFDQVAKVYYLCFTSNETDMNGLIMKRDGELMIDIAEDNDPIVQSPLNYNAHLGIMPQETAQVLNFAVSNTDKFVKTWGVAVTGT
ncbi:MAG: hypothetical protein RLZ75_1646 [Pseudomonadota bacterium]|jgi:hypothetical protein